MMSDVLDCAMIDLFLLEEEDDDDALLIHSRKKRNSPKRLYKTRIEEGSYSLLIRNHLISDGNIFRQYCRLNKRQFNFLLSLVYEELKPQCLRKVITAKEILYSTLRFLATGESYTSLSFAYRISKSYISRIVKRVLKTLRTKLVPILMPLSAENDFKRIEQDFSHKWNIPNCVGGIDGKHVRIKAPKKSGSLFFNYKDFFSIVLLAIVDANYKFLAVDVGAYGKESDNGIFQKSVMGKKIATQRFNIPPPKCLPGSTAQTPHFLIGDEAFALSGYMMKPYSRKLARLDRDKQIYNYRLCRGRRVTENAFGLISQVFRIFYTPIAVSPEIIDDLILMSCCLHNLLRDHYLEENDRPYYNYSENLKGRKQNNILSFSRFGGFSNREGFQVRETLKEYFCSEYGAVPWQEAAIGTVGNGWKTSNE